MKYTLYLLFCCCCFFVELPFGIAQLHVQGLLHVQDDALLYVEPDVVIETQDGIVENNGTVVVEGNLTKEAAASYLATSTTGSRKVILQGDSPVQRITGDFTGEQSFYELSLDKEAGMVELNSDIEVRQLFNLIQGKLRTDVNSGTQASDYQYELYISNPASSALAGNIIESGSNNFIEGRLRRSVAGLGNYSFPVGITENNPFFISFNEAAPLSDISASFEQGTSTLIGTAFSCPNTATTSVDCTIGNWNVQSNFTDFNYDIRFSPSRSLLQNCPDATAFFVSKDGSFDCNLDTNIDDGISSTQTGGFGVFDLPSGNSAPEMPTDCATPSDPIVNRLSRSQLVIEWSPVSEATGYILQARLKGRTNWAITAMLRAPRARVWAIPDNDFEYRVRTVCRDGSESAFSPVYEFSTRGNFKASTADSRATFKADIDFSQASVSLEKWQISPNPVNDRLQLVYEALTDKAQVSIIGVNGKKLIENTLSIDNSIHSIDVNNLMPGFYILMVNDGGRNVISEKIIKESRY